MVALCLAQNIINREGAKNAKKNKASRFYVFAVQINYGDFYAPCSPRG
jgi:hypothetical protein